MNISLPFGLTGEELRMSAGHCLRSYAHTVASFGIAFAINKLIHQQYNIKPNTSTSYAIKAAAFVIGTGVSLSLYSLTGKIPNLSLVAITGQKAMELFVFNMLMLTGFTLLSRRPNALVILTPLMALGPLTQVYGFPVTAGVAGFGGALGALL